MIFARDLAFGHCKEPSTSSSYRRQMHGECKMPLVAFGQGQNPECCVEEILHVMVSVTI